MYENNFYGFTNPFLSTPKIDLVEIKQKFLELFHKTLGTMIEGDTSGDYRKLLLAIVGPM